MIPVTVRVHPENAFQNEWLGVKNFIKRTHIMIDALSDEGGRIAQWSRDGSMFVVKDKTTLARHFQRFGFKKMKLYRSFEKQLNDHGFLKRPREDVHEDFDGVICQTSGLDPIFFVHPHFQRNCPGTMKLIFDRRCHSPGRKARKKVRSVSPSQKKNDEQEKEELRAQIHQMGLALQRMEQMQNSLSETLQRVEGEKRALFDAVMAGARDHPSPGPHSPQGERPCKNDLIEVLRLFRKSSNDIKATSASHPLCSDAKPLPLMQPATSTSSWLDPLPVSVPFVPVL